MDCVFSQQTCLRGDQLCLKTVACSAPWHDLQGCVGIKTNYLLTLPHSYQFYTPTVPYCYLYYTPTVHYCYIHHALSGPHSYLFYIPTVPHCYLVYTPTVPIVIYSIPQLFHTVTYLYPNYSILLSILYPNCSQ